MLCHQDRGYLLERITELEGKLAVSEDDLRVAEAGITELETQLDKVRDAFNIPDWQDCVNAIKAALEDE